MPYHDELPEGLGQKGADEPGLTEDEEAAKKTEEHYKLFKPYRTGLGGLITTQIGAPSYKHTGIDIDPAYADPMAKLQQLMSGENWEGINRQAQYEALAGISPGKAIAGAVGAVGSRAGGQVAEARKMSDMQMVQALSGAKVEVEKQKIQVALTASGEIRNISFVAGTTGACFKIRNLRGV